MAVKSSLDLEFIYIRFLSLTDSSDTNRANSVFVEMEIT